jgi:ABC-type transport system substrate-binding protein
LIGVHRFLLLIPLLLGIGCKGSFSSRSAAQREGSFRYALEKNVVTFDPGRIQDPEGIELIGNVYEGLVSYDENNQIVPQLASSFSSDESGKVWTFHLRPDAKFHTGRSVTAEDFKWSWERNLRPEFASPVALNYLSDIQGASEYAAGKGELTGVRVVDAKTLEVSLVSARPYFLGKLTYPCAFALDRDVAGLDEIRNLGQMVGTGAFKIEKIVPDQEVDLAANDDYYLGRPSTARIERPIVKDPVTRLSKYKEGSLDVLSLQRSDIDSVRRDPVYGRQLKFFARPVVYYVGLNQNAYPPFKKLLVRRAFAMAIDRHRIAKEILDDMTEAHGLLPKGIPGFRESYLGIPYDPVGAKQCLAQAGYPDGKGLPPLELDYRESTPDSRVIAEAIHNSLTKNLNFPVRLRGLEAGVFFERRNAGKMPSFFLSWGADYLDPQNFTTFLLRSDSSMNFEGYRNPAFDRVAMLADSEPETGKRIALYQQAETLLIQDVARIPLFFGREAQLVSPRVSGLRPNLMGNLPHLHVTVGR